MQKPERSTASERPPPRVPSAHTFRLPPLRIAQDADARRVVPSIGAGLVPPQWAKPVPADVGVLPSFLVPRGEQCATHPPMPALPDVRQFVPAHTLEPVPVPGACTPASGRWRVGGTKRRGAEESTAQSTETVVSTVMPTVMPTEVSTGTSAGTETESSTAVCEDGRTDTRTSATEMEWSAAEGKGGHGAATADTAQHGAPQWVSHRKRKIAIEPIADRKKRGVAFSKRRTGLMKKAQELGTLTGAQVLVLVVSDAGVASPPSLATHAHHCAAGCGSGANTAQPRLCSHFRFRFHSSSFVRTSFPRSSSFALPLPFFHFVSSALSQPHHHWVCCCPCVCATAPLVDTLCASLVRTRLRAPLLPRVTTPHSPHCHRRTGKAFHYATEGLAPVLGSCDVRRAVAELKNRKGRRPHEPDGASPHAAQHTPPPRVPQCGDEQR